MTEALVKESARPGRGFSIGELTQAGLTRRQVKALALRVDRRRRSVHQVNVDALKEMAKGVKAPPRKKKPGKAKAAKPAPKKQKATPLKAIPGLGPKREEQLASAGVKSVEDLLARDPAEVSEASGIPKATVEKFIKEGRKLAG
ncbi:MAG: hypothetical protein GXO65_04715 [Euryarchaeota archaeon]|nr:hypothetical protein [Euryarchaeota archaeon]